MHGPLVEIRGTLDAARFQYRRLGGDGDDLFDLRDAQRQGQGNGLADRQIQPFADHGSEVWSLDRDFVRPQREKESAETAFGISGQGAGEVGAEVGHRDLSGGYGAAGWVVDDPFNGAGVGLGLGENQAVADSDDRQKANEHEPVVTHENVLLWTEVLICFGGEQGFRRSGTDNSRKLSCN